MSLAHLQPRQLHMAHVEKYEESAVCNILRHSAREISNSSNKDIDPRLSSQNYSLLNRDMSPMDYFRARKAELHCLNRGDVKVLAGWIVTLPQELNGNRLAQEAFFKSVNNFLSDRYGADNVIQSIVHYDEGKREAITDRWGNPVLNEDGSPATRLVYGQPHLHFNFIPVSVDKKHGYEKICANDVINPRDLQHFHSDLQKHLDQDGIACSVTTGVTAKNGRNRTVEELKERTEMQREITQLRAEIARLHSMERGKNRWDR